MIECTAMATMVGANDDSYRGHLNVFRGFQELRLKGAREGLRNTRMINSVRKHAEGASS